MDLDNPSRFLQELDPGRVGDSISCLPDQIEQTLEDAGSLDIPDSHRNINKVVLNGMGGSNLGGRIVQSVFEEELSVPVLICPGYKLPGYVDENTLFLISSYSGNTEEPLSVYKEAKARGAKIAGITATGKNNKLERLMKEDGLPGFVFKPESNPSGQPRLGVGYSVFSILSILARAGFITLKDEDIKEVVEYLRGKNDSWGPKSETKDNKAKQIAEGLKGKIPILIGAEFLEGNLHSFRNQACETCKNFSDYLTLPDLNHFLLEGLAHPESNKDNLAFLFIDSDKYSDPVQKRSSLTKQVAEKNGIKVLEHKMEADSFIGQSLELLQLGGWITFYLAIANNENPSLIPWVNWFKEKLKE